MPAVLPFVFLPRPRDGSYDVAAEGTRMRWVPARNAERHLVFFGTDPEPERKGEQTGTVFDPGELENATRYYWRVDEIVGVDTLRGPTWHFTTH